MIDLVCVVADKSIEATVDALLGRHESLKICRIDYELVVHPERDPGCFQNSGKFLRGYSERARHALVVLDREWAGRPDGNASEIEGKLEQSLASVGPAGWVQAVVIDPELEVWVFSDSPHVAGLLGWKGPTAEFRKELEAQGLWARTHAKPSDPKRAMEWARRRANIPNSSSLFRELACKVSLSRCEDRSFLKLVSVLRTWFGADR